MYTKLFRKESRGSLLVRTYDEGTLTLKRISLTLPGDTIFTVNGLRGAGNLLKITCRVGGNVLKATFSYRVAERKWFATEEYKILGEGPLTDDPDINGQLTTPYVALNTIECIVARCYAHMRDEAKRIDLARGFSHGFYVKSITDRWQRQGNGTFTIKPARIEDTPTI